MTYYTDGSIRLEEKQGKIDIEAHYVEIEDMGLEPTEYWRHCITSDLPRESYVLVDKAGLGYNSGSILARSGLWQKAEPTL